MTLDPDALALLERYAWPGNVRELRNAIERAVVIADGDAITPRDLPARIGARAERLAAAAAQVEPLHVGSLKERMERFERDTLVAALRETAGNQTEAALLLAAALNVAAQTEGVRDQEALRRGRRRVSDAGLTHLAPGAVFHERYEIVRCLKAGGMGTVYEVLDRVTEAPRALKVMLLELLADDDMRARFAQEARVTGGVESEHVVRTSDAGVDARTGMPFLVMDLLRGEELGRLLKRRGRLPAEEVVQYLFQAAMALERTHAAGIVHRDLKPENLFITRRDDGSPCLKILDFGIAKVLARSLGAPTTRSIGTPLYMAPEQLEGRRAVGPRADLYALAHIAFALLAGSRTGRAISRSAAR